MTEFSGTHELASRLASDLHNWLFDRYLSPALSNSVRGNLQSAQALSGDLRHLATINRDLLAQVAEDLWSAAWPEPHFHSVPFRHPPHPAILAEWTAPLTAQAERL